MMGMMKMMMVIDDGMKDDRMIEWRSHEGRIMSDRDDGNDSWRGDDGDYVVDVDDNDGRWRW